MTFDNLAACLDFFKGKPETLCSTIKQLDDQLKAEL